MAQGQSSSAAVRAAVIKLMGNKSFLRPASLIESLIHETGESPITVRQSLGRLVREKWIEGVTSHGDPIGQVRIIGEVSSPPPCPTLDRWRSVLETAGLGDRDTAALIPLHTRLADFDASFQADILQGLLRLRENMSEEAGHHRFIVSAHYLIGSSKLLDTLPASALKVFGIQVDRFPGHPPYVVAAGCANPQTVILVENPAAFEMAVATRAVERCAFIATFGFGLSKSGEEYGKQLVELIETDRFAGAITLMREGSSCPPAKDLLNHPNITFWGDLDLAAIHIYLRLKKAIPGLRLSALYQPMIDAARTPGRHHPYVGGCGKDGQDRMLVPASWDDAAADLLLSQCGSFGVDQESVPPALVERLAEHELTLAGQVPG